MGNFLATLKRELVEASLAAATRGNLSFEVSSRDDAPFRKTPMPTNTTLIHSVSAGTRSVSAISAQSIADGTGSGSSVVATGSAAATLIGGDGNDRITSGSGNDWITGGLGVDTLTGGAGADRFVYAAAAESPVAGVDVIADFEATADLLVFGGGLLRGTFVFRGAADLTGSGNSEARFDDATKLLSVDLDGDGAADMGITLAGVALASLDRSDFIWP